MVKKLFLCAWVGLYASIGGHCLADPIPYFQAPVDGLHFASAQVYMFQDKPVERNRDTSLVNAIAWCIDQEIEKSNDKAGRFAVWKFVPSYIYSPDCQDKQATVEIQVSDESDMIVSFKNDSVKTGTIPYRVRCRYRILDDNGQVWQERDLGILQGEESAQNQQWADNLPASAMLGVNKAYRRVRQEVYSQYGFCTFDVHFSLDDIVSVPSLHGLKEVIEREMSQKNQLLPSEGILAKMRNYTDLLVFNKDRYTAEELTSCYRNLSLCYAWMGQPELALSAYNAWGKCQITNDARNEYAEVRPFVRYYPQAVQKYASLFRVIHRDWYRFVDFYAYNDLLSQLYDLEFLFPFLDDRSYENATSIKGELYRNNSLIGNYCMEYDKQARPKSFSASRITKDENGKPNMQKINNLSFRYDRKTGKYQGATTFNGTLTRMFMPSYNQLNAATDLMEHETKRTTENLLGGFLKLKVATTESVQAAVDLEGHIYMSGQSISSSPYLLFRQIAESNNVKFPAMFSENHTQHVCTLYLEPTSPIPAFAWEGNIILEKNSEYENHSYIRGDSVRCSLTVTDRDLSGKPTHLLFQSQMLISTNWEGETRWDIVRSDSTAVCQVRNDKQCKVSYNRPLELSIRYDEHKHWNELQCGSYRIMRKMEYK